MKKLLAVMLVVINISCFAQANKWFVSFSSTPTIGGPSASMKNQMTKQGFNETSSFSFLGWSANTEYPVAVKDVSLLIRAGKKISDRRSIYFVAGQTTGGSVSGFKNEGYSDFLGIFSGSYGQHVEIDYNIYQLTAGYLYSFPNTRTKIGIGPSVFVYNYDIIENYSNRKKHISVMPGATFTARIPLGREKKLFGVELVFEGNAAPPVKMKGNTGETDFQPGNANLLSANVGLALSFRR